MNNQCIADKCFYRGYNGKGIAVCTCQPNPKACKYLKTKEVKHVPIVPQQKG